MDAIECLRTSRSIRKFQKKCVPKEIEKILECGRWAPSGLNHQPWRIFVVSDASRKEQLSQCTHYGDIVLQAPHLFVIYLRIYC